MCGWNRDLYDKRTNGRLFADSAQGTDQEDISGRDFDALPFFVRICYTVDIIGVKLR